MPRKLWLAALLLATPLIILASAANAQQQTTEYWQYSASGRLQATQLADVDNDGVSEILVADEEGRFALLEADGQVVWSYLAPGDIATMEALDLGEGRSAILLAGDNWLVRLDLTGEQLWQSPLSAEEQDISPAEARQKDNFIAGVDPRTMPVDVTAYDYDQDGRDDILVLLDNGQLLTFDTTGNRLWSLDTQPDAGIIVDPQMIVSDFDGDNQDEIAISWFTPRRFSQLGFIDDNMMAWTQAVSRRITTMVAAPFDPDTQQIAVGTNFGQISLYNADGEVDWYRTVNVPITAMAFARFIDKPVLALGTKAGSVITYTAEGRRHWATNLVPDANREVESVLPMVNQPAAGQSGMAVILKAASGSGVFSDVLLLGSNGQTLGHIGDTDLPDITQITDVNNDNYHELLLGRFATLQLVGLGVGNSEYVQEWSYALDAIPSITQVVDLDNDGQDELLVGTTDGRLHALDANRAIRWLHAPGGQISNIAILRPFPGDKPDIVVVRQAEPQSIGDDVPTISWLELRNAQGERRWEAEIDGTVMILAVEPVGHAGQPSVFIGLSDGRLMAFDSDGELHWQVELGDLEDLITHLIVLRDPEDNQNRVLAFAGRSVYLVTEEGDQANVSLFAEFDQTIVEVFRVNQPGGNELSLGIMVFLADGIVHGLNWRGIEMAQFPWPYDLEGTPQLVISSTDGAIEAFQESITAFLVALGGDSLKQLDVVENQPVTPWQIEDVAGVSSLFWDDQDKDGRPDVALMGTDQGALVLYEHLHTRDPRLTLELDLASPVSMVSMLRRSSTGSPDLLAVTENSLVRLFRESENRPPLLTNPTILPVRGQYSIGVEVEDVESDEVLVQLEMFDPTEDHWRPISEQKLDQGNGPLFWSSIDPIPETEEARYRFRFDDGFYRGYLTPPAGPPVPILEPLNNAVPVMAGLLALVGAFGLVLYVRQSQSTATQSRRFYKQLTQNPDQTLGLLEQEYSLMNGSPDFLLQVANQARQSNDSAIANLADGLFLLDNRPQAGLPIIIRTLDETIIAENGWESAEKRLVVYRSLQQLLDAPSVTDLSLLRPQLVDLLARLEKTDRWSPVIGGLLPVLTNMRDSERVDNVDDRLVYLNQAGVRLRQLEDILPEFRTTVERTLVEGISKRWAGILSGEIEEQRGRAELRIMLKTKRLVPNGQTHVAMEIRNDGRAAAENVTAVLESNPSYQVFSKPQIISFLPSGRSRQVRFLVEPKVKDRFRVALSLTYDDRNQRDRHLAFGDMVHLLPPIREFSPTSNPYIPGTPLRRGSPLFFGREELFDFIVENAGNQTRRNVLMVVGQRRTGKTSALLHLQEHLPSHLIPVYIDCQSLGVTPGMPALLEELAWQIADELSSREIDVELPEHETWANEPTRLFQREFLPYIRSLLPSEATLVLVFDEFEAFEGMVDDGLLPRTMFTYMRHLMQHSEGLSFIFVGTRRLEEMSTDYWSVLFNIALVKKIDYLNEAAATRLITEPVAPNIVYDDLAIDKILRVTAGHPYFLQLVCYTMVKHANEQRVGYITISDVNAALDEMLRLGEVHFAYMWQRSDYVERALLTAVAHLMDRGEPLHPEELIEYLRSYSIDLDTTAVANGLNNLVERNIIREDNVEGATLYELRIGLVGLWVAKNKSLSRLHEHLKS